MIKKIVAIFYGALVVFALVAGPLAAPAPAFAGCCVCGGKPSQDFCDAANNCTGGTGGGAVSCTCDQNLSCVAAPSGTGTGTTAGKTTAGALENPLAGVCGGAEGQKCVQLVIGNVIKAALGIVGSIALLMITYGGFLWLTSMGNANQVEKGKNTLIWATIGLALIFGAYALTSYIIGIINK